MYMLICFMFNVYIQFSLHDAFLICSCLYYMSIFLYEVVFFYMTCFTLVLYIFSFTTQLSSQNSALVALCYEKLSVFSCISWFWDVAWELMEQWRDKLNTEFQVFWWIFWEIWREICFKIREERGNVSVVV